jgi:MinD-like ATPase involved in chromosome partitioning or flagellar assembly
MVFSSILGAWRQLGERNIEQSAQKRHNAAKPMKRRERRARNTAGAPEPPPALRPEDQLALKAMSIAVVSGKGGVGKTITAANLAIYYARKGLKVALVDLDPLSDVATLLDLVDAEAALGKTLGKNPGKAKGGDGGSALEAHRVPVFRNLDLLFSTQKLKAAQRQALIPTLYGEMAQALQDSYDLLVFDLPAGSAYEDNLAFLPYMGLVILVTNPEPTAHAAAGEYIRRACEQETELVIRIWHNRFNGGIQAGFNPKDVVGNYNRNVPEELQIASAAAGRLEDFAAVPEDPALNLLRGSPSPEENVLRFLLDAARFLHEERLNRLGATTGLRGPAFDLIRVYVTRHRRIGDIDTYLEEVGRFLRNALAIVFGEDGAGSPGMEAAETFSAAERSRMSAFLATLRDDPLGAQAARAIDALEERLLQVERRPRPLGPAGSSGKSLQRNPDKTLDREVAALLVELARDEITDTAIRNQGGLILFYFSLHKLFRSEKITALIDSLLPTRKDSRGRRVRDRLRQVRDLVEGNAEYKQHYLRTLKSLYPVVTRQMANVVAVFGLSGLLFRGPDGKVIRAAYVKLLTNFLHDTLYSGLSVVIGFPYRAAARAFSAGAEKALSALRVAHPSRLVRPRRAQQAPPGSPSSTMSSPAVAP